MKGNTHLKTCSFLYHKTGGIATPCFHYSGRNSGRPPETADKETKNTRLNVSSGTSHLKRDLMFFWGLHANSRFDEATIRYAVDNDISAVAKELQSLVEAGIIEKEIENGVAFYYLTLNEAKRQSIIDWARPGHSGR